MKIIENRVRCVHCDAQVLSTTPNGYSMCECGAVAISGGKEKLVRHSLEKNFVEESVVEIEGKKV